VPSLGDSLCLLGALIQSFSIQVSAVRRQLADSSQPPKEAAAASGSKAAGEGSEALRGENGKAVDSGSSTQRGAAPHGGFKATSVLVGELGKAAPWEVVKAEEDRKRREQVCGGGLDWVPPLLGPRTHPDTLAYGDSARLPVHIRIQNPCGADLCASVWS